MASDRPPTMSNKPVRRPFYRTWARALRRARREVAEFFSFLYLGIFEAFRLLSDTFYAKSLPLTRRLFSRIPNPPIVGVQDIRAGRIRLDIKSSFSSAFNVELFEIEWTVAGEDDWKSSGAPNDLMQRTVARLKPHTSHQFRVRASNERGVSRWSGVVQATTRIDPVDGGGFGPGYTWTQTATEVVTTFELPFPTAKRDILLVLKGEALLVELHPPPLPPPQSAAAATCHSPRSVPRSVVLEGVLYGKVHSFENGSYWELVKENGKQLLILTFEKQSKSLAPKFDYWRSLVLGHDEIDTHKIVSEQQGQDGGGGGMQMLQPGKMDAAQLQQFGLA